MRTREELEKARQPQFALEPAKYASASTDGDSVEYGELVPVKKSDGETYEQQIHEILLDIRELLQEKRPSPRAGKGGVY